MHTYLLGCLLLICSALSNPLLAQSENLNPEVLAAARLANDQYQRHISKLIRLTGPEHDVDERVRAVRLLGRTFDPQVLPVITQYIVPDTHPAPLIEAAIHAVTFMGDSDSETAIRALIDNDNEALDRAARNALSVLGQLGPADHQRAAGHSDVDVQGSGVTNIGTTEVRQATDLLVSALQDRNVHVRRMAVIGLGKIGDNSHGAELIRALHDADPFVRRYASEALVRLDHKPAIPYLLLALESNVIGSIIHRATVALTGEDFGWSVDDNRVLQQEAVERGFVWWTENADRFTE